DAGRRAVRFHPGDSLTENCLRLVSGDLAMELVPAMVDSVHDEREAGGMLAEESCGRLSRLAEVERNHCDRRVEVVPFPGGGERPVVEPAVVLQSEIGVVDDEAGARAAALPALVAESRANEEHQRQETEEALRPELVLEERRFGVG